MFIWIKLALKLIQILNYLFYCYVRISKVNIKILKTPFPNKSVYIQKSQENSCHVKMSYTPIVLSA